MLVQVPPNYSKNDFESVSSTLSWNLENFPGGQLNRDQDNANFSCRYRVVYPYFEHPALTSSFQVHALCRCCRQATTNINHHSKAEIISKLTVHSQLLQHYFSSAKNVCFVNEEVWAGCCIPQKFKVKKIIFRKKKIKNLRT